MKHYRIYLAESGIGFEGLSFWMQEGESVNVNGVAMVQMEHAIVPATGFHESKDAAMEAAADRIDVLGRRLIAQAVRMRRGSDCDRKEVEVAR